MGHQDDNEPEHAGRASDSIRAGSAMATAARTTPHRIFDSPALPVPEVHLLSNGRYHVMVTSGGGGYSHWDDLALTRWREDATCDNCGFFCYVRDLGSGHFWSSTYQPTTGQADAWEAAFPEGRAIFRRRDRDIETTTDIAVSQQDDVEVRRIRVTNRARARRELDLTSYAETVLVPPPEDAAHPAFNKLFIETTIDGEHQAILCTRRQRTPDEPTPWMFHMLAAHQPIPGDITYETDRMRFIGRGRTTADPQALREVAALTGSAGPVLDPVVAIRCPITLGPSESATVDLVSGVATTREACLALLRKCREQRYGDGVFAAAPAYGRALRNSLHVSASDAQCFEHLASSVIYANDSLRAEPDVLARNRLGQSSLWGYSISGDLPIVLLRMADARHLDLVCRLIDAHTYWRLMGLGADLVIVCEDQDGHEPRVRERIMALAHAHSDIDGPAHGGVFVCSAEAVDDQSSILLQTVARIVIGGDDTWETLTERGRPPLRSMRSSTRPLPVEPSANTAAAHSAIRPKRHLLFGNGLGGFTPDGREYVVTVGIEKPTPAPWVNVLANPWFGSLVSESGSATTWSENAQEFRLTPWSNDPVGDANTEAYYLRDEDSGHFWSATLLPSGGETTYHTRHGLGYSVFKHREDGIESDLCVYVALDAPVKFARLTLRNLSSRPRRLSVTGYLEWVLGDQREKTRMHVITGRDADSGALLAYNPYNTDFAGRTAFFDTDDMADRSFSSDREAFLGRNGSLRYPAAMSQLRLSDSVGAGLDPCAAIRVQLDIPEGQACQVVFRLGAAPNVEVARELIARWRGLSAARRALAAVKRYWRRTLDAVQISTPDRALDVLANGWLVYQVLACRLWGRNAFYQSSGAFGFRDQLQDVMALVHATPDLVREHLLRSAARQFPEGDVQHWWHPPAGRGVRTRCSDDYLWLPLATCRYVAASGDTGVLDEPVPFLDGSALDAGQQSSYALPRQSQELGSLYQHCVRAIEHGLRFGAHGLPLMGSGDWNDGMNLVGAGGSGESVWLGFFLCAVLKRFGELARRHHDPSFAERCLRESDRLRDAIEQSSWDGEWYRRAWFDDGSPLGSAENDECRIDSIAQSWSVLSGAGNMRRARQAMDAVDLYLVRREDALVQLLDPPFNQSEPDPGYIKGYLRGVRENGGQYTHAAVWAAMAFAALGDAERAWQLCKIINPIHHAASAAAIAAYRTEPYVLASDIYALAPHVGRGGWTWYTGSAGWMYQFIIESLLGLRRAAERLYVVPCVPVDWTSFEVVYRYRKTAYRIAVLLHTTDGKPGLTIDGFAQSGQSIPLVDDRRPHFVEVRV